MKIEYYNRYSQTDEPDNLGRWARLAVYKNVRIAWISRVIVKEKTTFIVSLHFPTMQNDTANEHKTFASLKNSKQFIEKKWNWFIENIAK